MGSLVEHILCPICFAERLCFERKHGDSVTDQMMCVSVVVQALTNCKDAAGKKLISVEDTKEALKLSGTFFVELVSPYSMTTEGYFRTFPVVQQGFEIVLNKQVGVMASTGVQLFISSVMAYARNDEDGSYEGMLCAVMRKQ